MHAIGPGRGAASLENAINAPTPAPWGRAGVVEACKEPGGSGLLAVLLDARGAQTGQTMLVDRELPREKFVDSQRIAAAGFFERKKTAAHSGNNFGLAADDPPFGAGRWQIRNGKRATVWPDDVFDPRAMRFCHGVLTNSTD